MTLVESREDIKPRPSLLDPDMPVSVHPAPDILGFIPCSCGCNRGSLDVLQQGLGASNYGDYHLHGVDVLSRPLRILIRSR